MLNELTISELVGRLAKREVSARDATQACLDRIQRVDGQIQAFISYDAADALAQADAADQALAQGQTHAQKPLLGVPIGIKDVIAVKGQPLNCGSKILGNFVVALRRDGDREAEGGRGGGVRPLEHGRVRHGQLDGELGLPGHAQSVGHVAHSRRLVRRLGGGGGGGRMRRRARLGHGRLDPPAGRASAAASASSRPTGASRATAWWPTRRRWTRSAASPKTCATRPPCSGSSAATIRAIPRACRSRCRITLAGAERRHQGTEARPAQGVHDRRARPGGEAGRGAAVQQLAKLGAEIVEVSLPHTDYAIATYYIIATAEASANLARFDGIRYGARVDGADPIELYGKTRGAGFGAEVKRRIILGTYVLSSGYYDAYYLRAQKVRTLIRQDFLKAFEKVDAIVTPTTPTAAFKIGEKSEDPLQMYLSDIFTISAISRASAASRAVRLYGLAAEAAHWPATAGQTVRRGDDSADRPRLRAEHGPAKEAADQRVVYRGVGMDQGGRRMKNTDQAATG